MPNSLSYVTIIDSAPTPLILVDTGGAIRLANEEAGVLFGYGRDVMQTMSIDDLVPMPFRGHHAEHRGGFHRRPAKRGMSMRRDLFALKSGGREFPVEVLLNPVRIGEESFVLAAVIDLTERKRLEEQRRRAEALERSNAELQQFAYVASHDLQSPLRAIAGFAQLVQSDHAATLGPEVAEYLDRIVAGVRRMQRLIDDLLAFARVESRAQPFIETDLREVLADVLEMMTPAISEAGVAVTYDELPVIDCDPTQMGQLLQNLIGNAITYRAKQHPAVHLFARRDDDGWTIGVRDNGIGVDPKHHEQIFEVFRRLHTNSKYPGTGIGLAVCRRIVDRHGGRLWIESTLGEGSTFYFSIPERRGTVPEEHREAA